ncbi:hypothetical protein EAH89_17345 [Roseomonas nepalensis]|uniref:Uncharacterized protein n=1 Tax=Muricoccus nepalensis TaxID=1854500 RepID=A0A502FWH1_9PROT|nr:hypothetical protein EAH89_17345 [Roseomonas nepalensis]
MPANPLDSLKGARLVLSGSKLLSSFAGTPVTASGGVVSVLADQTAIAQDLVLGGGPNAPTFRKPGDAGFQSSYFNGRPYLTFDGNNQRLVSSTINSSTGGILVVAVIRRRTNQPQGYGAPLTVMGDAPNANNHYPFLRPYFRPDAGIYLGNYDYETGDVPASLDTPIVMAFRRNLDGTGRLRINDAVSGTLQGIANPFPGKLMMGNSVFPDTPPDGYQFTAAFDVSDVYVTDALGDEDLLVAHFSRLLGLKPQSAVDAAWVARQAANLTGTDETASTGGSTGGGSTGGGTTPVDTTPSTAYDSFARVYDPATKIKPMPSTGTVAGVVFAPTVTQPSSANDIIGFGFTGPSGVTLPQRMMFFAINFAPGKVQPTDNIEVVYAGSAKEAQMVVLSKHADDGSVDHAQIITTQPQIVNGAAVLAMLRKTATPLSGADVGTDAYATSPIAGTVVYKKRKGLANVQRYVTIGGVYYDTYIDDSGAETVVNTTFNMAPSQLLTGATSSDVRYSGKLASERRFYINCGHALRMNVDVTTFKDGNQDYAWEIMADQCRVPGVSDVGSYFVDINITQGGTPVIQRTNQRIYNLGGWGKFIQTSLSAAQNASNNPPDTCIIFDAGELQRLAVVPPYDLLSGVYESLLAGYASAADGNFRLPYHTAGTQNPNMGGTGGRPDIGVLTQWAQTYFVTMDPRARQWVIAQAEAFRGIPANQWDPINKVPLNNFPGIGTPGAWWDYGNRGTDQGKNPPNMIRTEFAIQRDWDGAHQPMFAYAAYLITGRRQFGDALERQGCYTLGSTFVDARWRQIGGEWHDWCFMQENQPRQAGWAARDIAFTVRLAPDSSAIRLPMRRVLNWNFGYLLSQVPAWRAQQGETYGWLPFSSPYGQSGVGNLWDLKAWMMDHAMAGTWAAVVAGSENAMTYTQSFAKNFYVGRCMHEDVMPLGRGATYRFMVSSSHDIFNPPFTENTWAKLANAAESKWGPNQWDAGNYGRLQMRSNVLIASITNDADARTVCGKHRAHANDSGPYLALSDVRGDPLDWFRELAWA